MKFSQIYFILFEELLVKRPLIVCTLTEDTILRQLRAEVRVMLRVRVRLRVLGLGYVVTCAVCCELSPVKSQNSEAKGVCTLYRYIYF